MKQLEFMKARERVLFEMLKGGASVQDISRWLQDIRTEAFINQRAALKLLEKSKAACD